MFDPKGKSVPCVGISLGIERIFTVLETKERREGKKQLPFADVYVASAQKHLVTERMKICNELWNADIKAEHSYKNNPKLLDQMHYCEEHNIPLAIIIGQSEIERGIVKFRKVGTRDEIEIPRERLIEEVRSRLESSTFEDQSTESVSDRDPST